MRSAAATVGRFIRVARAVAITLAIVLVSGARSTQQTLAIATANENRIAAGTFSGNELALSLEVVQSMWYPDGDSLPGMPIETFQESGRQPTTPGPLLRVNAGTDLRITVRNSLERDTLTFYVPARIADATRGGALDSIVLAPREVRELRVRAARPGTYLYHANGRTTIDRRLGMRGLLSGALVVDTAGVAGRRSDRVLVLQTTVDSLTPAGVPDTRREILAINGRSWPHTERLEATVGDTVAWRVINGSPDVHPMHLHGFYFRVHAFDGPQVLPAGKATGGRMAVTEHMLPQQTMTLTWVPERPGNWLFHCHYQPHAGPHRPLGPAAATGTVTAAHQSHVAHEMGGLVMGVHVKPRAGEVAASQAATRRRLRLVAVRDSGFPAALPSMRFMLEERGQRATARPGISPTIQLSRGEPVSITVVNRLGEPLSVHWHGIELESFFDGVAGFAGAGQRLAPMIAPSDSFEARMTPPRSGTFMYHSHVDEPRHHRAGLAGALVVRDGGTAPPATEHLLFIKSARGSTGTSPMEINGQVNPDTIVLRVGRAYRFRLVNLAVTSPNATVYLTARPDSSLENLRDTMLVRWRPLAKDGADVPESGRALRPAQQLVSIGETYDFEVQPLVRGELRIEVRPVSAGRLFVRVPVRVE
jgi:FtsP/CotA-like multicopper oxidase with cupredoxin domain